MYKEFGIRDEIIEAANKISEEIDDKICLINDIREYNQLKVIKAMQDNGLSDMHFNQTTGYGYNDRGREVLDNVYASVFKAQKGLVRSQIVSGTHALSLVLFGILRPNDELLAITGKPYDTMEEVIGIKSKNPGSLKDFGVSYRQVDLKDDGKIDIDNVKKCIRDNTKMIMIQRSRGYSFRDSFSIDYIE